MISKFIPIIWQIDRNDSYITIDCIKAENSKKTTNIHGCQKSIIGCDLQACGCNDSQEIYINVFDKHNNLISQTRTRRVKLNKIIINKDSLGKIIAKIE